MHDLILTFLLLLAHAGARGDNDPDWKKKPSERAKKEPKSPRPW